jgi:flavodoxin
MKPIVLYYSKTGITEELAKKTASTLGCDILKVELEKPYGNFFSTIFRVLKEKSKGIIPPVKTPLPSLEPFDTIFAGYPVWASNIPSFFADFIKRCDLKGKRVIPFATSGSSGIECTMNTLKEICPDSEIIHPFIRKASGKGDFDKWIQIVRG